MQGISEVSFEHNDLQAEVRFLVKTQAKLERKGQDEPQHVFSVVSPAVQARARLKPADQQMAKLNASISEPSDLTYQRGS